MKRILWAGAVLAAAIAAALADQSERVPPTSGAYSGVEYSQKLGDGFRSVSTSNKGSTAPANVSGSTVDGLEWLDDSVTPWIKKRYINGGWAVEGAYDPTDSSYIGVIGGGSATLAIGSTVDLGSVPQANVLVSGAGTISSFGSSAPAYIEKTVRFDNVSVLTPSGSLLVPGGFPLSTAPGDRAKVTHLGSGNWEITVFTRANGIPIDISAVGDTKFTQAVSIPPLHVAGYGQALLRTSYPAYLAKTTRAQNGTRISGNATITGIADTSGFGPGMPIESTGVNAGCIIASVVANTSITLNSAGCVTASGTSNLTVFPHGYGAGGGATTVGVDDCRGRGLAGRDRNDPGSLANRLTTNWFGANSAVFGVTGGLESQTLSLGQLPTGINSTSGAITITVAGSNIPETSSPPNQFFYNSLSGTTEPTIPLSSGLWNFVNSLSGTNTINTTSTNTGGNAHPIVQPTLIEECVVRVTP